MITLEQIKQWAVSGESETLEFKRSTGERKEAAMSICAMLNHKGGRVVFGIERDGRVVGQDVSDKSVEDVTNELREIDPPSFPIVQRIDVLDGRQLIVVETSAGTAKPYAYKGISYRRVGNTNQALSRDEYNKILFERLHSEQRWENQIAEGWDVADLDYSEVTRTLDEAVRRGRAEDPGTRDPKEVLRGFGLLKNDKLLRAAVILFGKRRKIEPEMPQCLLRVARFKGTTKTEFIDNRQFFGNIFELLSKAERFMRDNLPVAGRIQPTLFERVDDPIYPPVALREALANAFCHRDYSIGGGSVSVGIYDDRLEITSSGELHFGLTPEALFSPHESLPWNPLIARVLFRRGLIESWGRGTLKMAELTTLAGLPAPRIEQNAGCVNVIFAPSKYVPPLRVPKDLTQRQQEILGVLNEYGSLTLAEIIAKLKPGISQRQLRVELTDLQRINLIQVTGHARGARWNML
jgi:ATP-dependent DNA helicase RecG